MAISKKEKEFINKLTLKIDLSELIRLWFDASGWSYLGEDELISCLQGLSNATLVSRNQYLIRIAIKAIQNEDSKLQLISDVVENETYYDKLKRNE